MANCSILLYFTTKLNEFLFRWEFNQKLFFGERENIHLQPDTVMQAVNLPANGLGRSTPVSLLHLAELSTASIVVRPKSSYQAITKVSFYPLPL